MALDDVHESHFQPLVEHNVGWIAQTPFGWQQQGGPGPGNSDFIPQDKPAARVLARWFEGPR